MFHQFKLQYNLGILQTVATVWITYLWYIPYGNLPATHWHLLENVLDSTRTTEFHTMPSHLAGDAICSTHTGFICPSAIKIWHDPLTNVQKWKCCRERGLGRDDVDIKGKGDEERPLLIRLRFGERCELPIGVQGSAQSKKIWCMSFVIEPIWWKENSIRLLITFLTQISTILRICWSWAPEPPLTLTTGNMLQYAWHTTVSSRIHVRISWHCTKLWQSTWALTWLSAADVPSEEYACTQMSFCLQNSSRLVDTKWGWNSVCRTIR